MLLKFLEGRYLVRASVDEVSGIVQSALSEVGLKGVAVKKEVPPNYLLMAYSPGWVGKALEIEFVFKERQDGTEVHVKWPYAEKASSDGQDIAEFEKREKERRQAAAKFIEKFKSQIGAVDL